MAARDACVCVCALADVCRRVHLGVGVRTHPVTTQPLPERKVPEAWPCGMVGLVINRGAAQEGCRMINWAQDLICNVLMKMKRGWRVVLKWWWYMCVCVTGDGGQRGALMKLFYVGILPVRMVLCWYVWRLSSSLPTLKLNIDKTPSDPNVFSLLNAQII